MAGAAGMALAVLIARSLGGGVAYVCITSSFWSHSVHVNNIWRYGVQDGMMTELFACTIVL